MYSHVLYTSIPRTKWKLKLIRMDFRRKLRALFSISLSMPCAPRRKAQKTQKHLRHKKTCLCHWIPSSLGGCKPGGKTTLENGRIKWPPRGTPLVTTSNREAERSPRGGRLRTISIVPSSSGCHKVKPWRADATRGEQILWREQGEILAGSSTLWLSRETRRFSLRMRGARFLFPSLMDSVKVLCAWSISHLSWGGFPRPRPSPLRLGGGGEEGKRKISRGKRGRRIGPGDRVGKGRCIYSSMGPQSIRGPLWQRTRVYMSDNCCKLENTGSKAK